MKNYKMLSEEQDDIVTQLSVLVDKMKDFGPTASDLEEMDFLSHCLKDNEVELNKIYEIEMEEERALMEREDEMERIRAIESAQF